jgi:hypothetical protein
MLPKKVSTTVTGGAGATTVATFSPSVNGSVIWSYHVDNLGLTQRSGTVTTAYDVSSATTADLETHTADLVSEVATPGAVAAAVGAAGAANTAGDHTVKVSYYTVNGDTLPSVASATCTVTAANEDIDVTAIPTSGDAAVVGRHLWMNEASGATWYLAATVANNTGTTATIAIDDVTLAGGTAAPVANTTALADTTDITLATSMAGGAVSLKATAAASDWTVKITEIARY